MILQSVTLTSWRGYRNATKIDFKPGFNLISGPNEAGKSTLLEALARGLFDSSKGKREELRELRPIGTNLAPQVEIEFAVSGEEYRVIKRFLKEETSELWIRGSTGWVLHKDGDAAETAVRELASGGERGNGRNLTPELRGVAEALWHLQTDAEDLPKQWAPAIRQGLGGVVQVAIESRQVTRFIGKLQDHYSELYTATGRVKADGQLLRAQTALAEQQQRVDSLYRKRDDAEEIRSQLGIVADNLRLKAEEIAATQLTLAGIEQRAIAADQFEKELTDLEHSQAGLKNDAVAIETVWAALLKREAANDAIRPKLSNLQISIGALRQQIENTQNRLKELSSDKSQLLDTQAMSDARAVALRAAGAVRRLEKDRERLQSHLKRLEESRSSLAEIRRQLGELNAPTEAERDGFNKLARELDRLRLECDLNAIRVRFELDDNAGAVTAMPNAELTEGEFVVLRETSFSMGALGRVTVRGGGRSIEELSEALEQAELSVKSELGRFGAQNEAEYEARFRSAQELRGQQTLMVRQVNDLVQSQPDAEEELRRTEDGIAQETIRARPVESEVHGLGGQQIRGLEAAAQTESDAARDRLASNDRELARNQTELNSLQQQILNEEVEKQGLTTELAGNEAENVKVIGQFGSREALDSTVSRKKQEIQAIAEDLDSRRLRIDAEVNLPRNAVERARRELQQLMDGSTQLDIQQSNLEGQIRAVVGNGFYEELGDAERSFDELERRCKALEIRGEALKRLTTMVQEHRDRQSHDLARPIIEVIEPWLDYVSDSRYGHVSMGASLIPDSVHGANEHTPLQIGMLSCGTREQVVLLTRLALAKIISRNSPFPVVLDDRLINSDPHRRKRMIEVLMSIAKSTQVVVTTCNENLYSGIEGNRISLDALRATS